MAKINNYELINFSAFEQETVISNDNKTVMQEVQLAFGYSAKTLANVRLLTVIKNPELISGYSKYETALRFRAAEYSVQDTADLETKTLKMIQNTAKKIVWLSQMCKKITGKTFIEGFVDLNDVEMCLDIITEFHVSSAKELARLAA